MLLPSGYLSATLTNPVSTLLQRLNSRQREAVLHGSGPMLILAGAGSGKTSTMAHRIAHLIAEKKQPANSILGLSFTRKAATELKERVTRLISKAAGGDKTRGLLISTFHSLCVRILREHATQIGYGRDFSILDSNDQLDLIRELMKAIKLDERKFDAGLIQFQISQAKNRFLVPERSEDYFFSEARLSPDYAEIIFAIYPRYQERLRLLNAMDFDDLLFQAVHCLESKPVIRDHYRMRLKHILVDEYQDTNPAQFKLLNQLLGPDKNICVVGDDDQSIYGWRGADSRHILEFTQHFKGAKIVTLDQNYRSTSLILDAANGVISQNSLRHPKKLWSDRGVGEPLQLVIAEEDRAEAEFIGEEILRRATQVHEGRKEVIKPWKDFAVLFRSNPQSRLFEEALRMRQIPYKLVGALSFLDRKEVKDTLSYWKLLVNPKDDAAARRVVNWPTRGFGRTALEKVHDASVAQGNGFLAALADLPTLYPRAADAGAGFTTLLERLRAELATIEPTGAGLSSWAKRSLDQIGVRKALSDENDDPIVAERKWESVEELANAAGMIDCHALELEIRERDPEGKLDGPTLLREFLAKLALNALDEEEDKKNEKERDRDEVTLMTLHGAKGLEFPVVFMVGMEDGLLPHQRTIDEGTSLDEERRLCYVGITRAKDQLILTRCRTRTRYGKSVPRNPSRFIAEIPQELIVTRNESHSPELDTPAERERHEVRIKDFLSQIRSGLGPKAP